MDVVIDGPLRDLPRPVAFVLSGGGSLGSAQVGHLLALQDRNLMPDLVVGTSVGAINGAVVADNPSTGAGKLRQIWEGVRRPDVLPMRPRPLVSGLIRGQAGLWPLSGLTQLVQRNLSTQQMRDLSVPLHAIATDALTGDLVDLAEGSIVDALLASSAIPGVFPTHRVEGRWLFDGGVRAQVPVNHAMGLGARTAIVLDASGPCELTRPPGSILESIAVAMRFLTRGQSEAQTLAASQRGLVLYLPTPCTRRRSPLDFSGSALLLEQTRELTRLFLDQIAGPLPSVGLIGRAHTHEEPCVEGPADAPCPHVEEVQEVTPSAEGCEDCLRSGGTWEHLRLCLTCGHVGCCDNSPHRHATAHWHATGHPIIRSLQPGEDWWWCYADEVLLDAPSPRPSPPGREGDPAGEPDCAGPPS